MTPRRTSRRLLRLTTAVATAVAAALITLAPAQVDAQAKKTPAKQQATKKKTPAKKPAPTEKPAASATTTGPTTDLKRGLVITKSTRITPKSYRLTAAASLDSALIVVKGDNITLDLTGVTINGADPFSDPDRFAGVAIRVEGGTNVTIKGGTIHGFRVGIIARNTKTLTVADANISYTWKPRLYSTVEHESLADWLSFHHSEQKEWLRFGAALYLDGVSGGDIKNVTAEHGMNGLMMVKSDHLMVHDNTFAYNSGLGVGMYRATDNTLLHNTLDYNVRGFSEGFYRRGQDSADLLMFEQSSRNIVAYNSATHGGDGLFLWAGQSTMDTGIGGANDNLFFANDFSYAPTNAMELTFSRNTLIANVAKGSDYGLWGGYSFDTKIVSNCFVRNRTGIAIEHGQDNFIAVNRFEGERTAVRLWADKVEPSDWMYPKKKDTQNRNNSITGNMLSRSQVGFNIANARGLQLANNTLAAVDTAFVMKDTLGLRNTGNAPVQAVEDAADPCATMGAIPAEFDRLAPAVEGIARTIPVSPMSQRPRSAIVVDEWGPFDWRAPKLWPVDSTHSATVRLAVLGPDGKWSVVSRRGLAGISATAGIMSDTITVTPAPDGAGDWELVLEYKGAATLSPRGESKAANVAQRFSYRMFEPATDWNVKFYAWADTTDPRTKSDAFNALLKTTPLTTDRTSRLDYIWARPTIIGLPSSKWALEAISNVTVPAGTHTLRTISDDAVRVWVDGALVIDNWVPHESTVDAVPISAGKHELRVQYVQVDGWTELRLEILKGAQRASGSPGPH
ncbi:MAG: right-handed parallel beta-helix repeat-containing protein [Gemmatimonadetes bacterium]|nr:right-handed parallel beta-helix repeat-containing protein [Gemmatimonadota bacterium]